MKSQKSSEIKVGMTVFIGTLLLVWVIIWAKGISVFEEKRDIQIEFSSVPGLAEGDPVDINGVRTGRVNNIELQNNSVIVDVEISNSVRLASDATFSLLMLDMMGGKKISISPGISLSELDYSKTQKGFFPGDISTAIAALNSVQSDLVIVVKDAKKSLGLVNELLEDGKLKSEFLESLNNLQLLTKNVSSVFDENKKNIGSMISNGSKLAASVEEVIQSNKVQFSSLLVQMSELAVKSKSLISSMNSIIDETKAKNNNAGKLLYDKEMYDNLKTTLNQLNELTKIFTEQLKKDGLNVDAHIF